MLTFDLLILKVVSESRLTWATSVPILVFLGLSVLELGSMYATDRQTDVIGQTDVRQQHRLMHPPYGGGDIISDLRVIQQRLYTNCCKFRNKWDTASFSFYGCWLMIVRDFSLPLDLVLSIADTSWRSPARLLICPILLRCDTTCRLERHSVEHIPPPRPLMSQIVNVKQIPDIFPCGVKAVPPPNRNPNPTR